MISRPLLTLIDEAADIDTKMRIRKATRLHWGKLPMTEYEKTLAKKVKLAPFAKLLRERFNPEHEGDGLREIWITDCEICGDTSKSLCVLYLEEGTSVSIEKNPDCECLDEDQLFALWEEESARLAMTMKSCEYCDFICPGYPGRERWSAELPKRYCDKCLNYHQDGIARYEKWLQEQEAFEVQNT